MAQILYESFLEFVKGGGTKTSESSRVSVFPVGGTLDEMVQSARKQFNLGPEWRVSQFKETPPTELEPHV